MGAAMAANPADSDLAPVKMWQQDIFVALRAADVSVVCYVPDAGHANLIDMCRAEPQMTAAPLSTEEEGIPLAAGAWLGGLRSVLLMQSSGVGNCLNMFSLAVNGRFPLLSIITMRGEWAEFNPWQVPMGRATEPALQLMDHKVFRVEDPDEVGETVAAAAQLAFDADQCCAVLLGQRLIGRKSWSGAQ